MKSKVVASFAVLTGGLASACCLGPLVLAAIGFSGAGFAARFESYRVPFLAATAVMLGYAFYLAYRREPTADCADGSCRPVSSRGRAALWIIAAFAAVTAAFPYWSGLLAQAVPVATQAAEQIVTLSVSGMDCAACTAGIRSALKKVPGVKEAAVDFGATEAVVITASGGVDHAALIRAVEKSGPYKARVKVAK